MLVSLISIFTNPAHSSTAIMLDIYVALSPVFNAEVARAILVFRMPYVKNHSAYHIPGGSNKSNTTHLKIKGRNDAWYLSLTQISWLVNFSFISGWWSWDQHRSPGLIILVLSLSPPFFVSETFQYGYTTDSGQQDGDKDGRDQG